MQSYPILSANKYTGSPSASSAPKIAPEEIISMIGEAPTVGSYGHATTTHIFTKDGVVTKTANNRFVIPHADFLKNGYFSQRDDYEIEGMKKAGEGVRPDMFDIIPKMPDFGLIVSPSLGMYFPDKGDTPVSLRTSHDIVNAVNPNRLGYSHSKLANFEGDLRNLQYDNANRLNYEPAEWINFLAKKGFSIDTTPNPGIIGLGVEKGDFLAAYYPGKDYLIREENFQDKARNLISKYGLTCQEAVEAMKRSVMLHEIGHVLGIGGGRRHEKLQGLLQAEFYSIMAQGVKGTKMERIYRALAQEGKDYAKGYSLSLLDLISGESNEGSAELREIKRKFLVEAVKSGVEDVEGYVNRRMEETLGPILSGEPSYKPSGNNPKPKTSKSEYKSMKGTREREAREYSDNDSEVSATEADGPKRMSRMSNLEQIAETGNKAEARQEKQEAKAEAPSE